MLTGSNEAFRTRTALLICSPINLLYHSFGVFQLNFFSRSELYFSSAFLAPRSEAVWATAVFPELIHRKEVFMPTTPRSSFRTKPSLMVPSSRNSCLFKSLQNLSIRYSKYFLGFPKTVLWTRLVKSNDVLGVHVCSSLRAAPTFELFEIGAQFKPGFLKLGNGSLLQIFNSLL